MPAEVNRFVLDALFERPVQGTLVELLLDELPNVFQRRCAFIVHEQKLRRFGPFAKADEHFVAALTTKLRPEAGPASSRRRTRLGKLPASPRRKTTMRSGKRFSARASKRRTKP